MHAPDAGASAHSAPADHPPHCAGWCACRLSACGHHVSCASASVPGASASARSAQLQRSASSPLCCKQRCNARSGICLESVPCSRLNKVSSKAVVLMQRPVIDSNPCRRPIYRDPLQNLLWSLILGDTRCSRYEQWAVVLLELHGQMAASTWLESP